MTDSAPDGPGIDGDGPVIRDRRRIDPDTGQVREPEVSPVLDPTVDAVADSAEADSPAEPVASADSSDVAAERLADLQRLQAEYVNYRKRVERDRDVARELAVSSVIEALLPVLDDVYLARQHGDLEGPFAAIADKLEATLGRFEVVRFGEPGQPFDPALHEALLRTEVELAAGTDVTTVVQVLQPGYRLGERIIRAARVAVADPPEPQPQAKPADTE
jgi:molecular chaperone GrpE